MGLHKWWQVTWMILYLFLSSFVEGSHAYDHGSLDAFFRNHANKEIGRPRTGVFYNLSLPANYTGMEIAVIRLRTDSFWLRGVKHSFLNFPPRVVPQPNRERMAIVYENLGNWSSHYYNVPNHTMVAPVFGFRAYTSSEKALISTEKMDLIIEGDPITIQFHHVGPHEKNNTPICAKFGAGGSVEFNNMTKPYVCEAETPGHYTLVVKSPKKIHISPKIVHPQSQSKGFNTWWVLGFVIGSVGLVIFALVLIALVKEAKRRRIRKMEKISEGGEPFDTFWIGDTKLPLAPMIRTQPVLENDDAVSD
ncbi:uncharacterized protein LOC130746199 [Lotus japonicus]|uniref:uncharacterized protein LOC130746199 n=1 Tax=Lotus japonicus TaxID=34305 RepID=UPI002583E460|nr:uncharacterized protein LOC130746199 [Lotus japonicus]